MEKVEKLQEKAKNIRRDIIEMLGHAKSWTSRRFAGPGRNYGGTVFRRNETRFQHPQWEDRDYFVLSKGHAAPALYAVLYEGGIISDEELLTLRQVAAVYRDILIAKNFPA